jgi:tRNA-specific 2-thiouridylase
VKRRSPQSFSQGQLVTTEGKVVGSHEGHQHFTIGQRKGVGVAFGYPIYVVDIDPASNTVTLGEHEALLKSSLVARQINLLSSRLEGAARLTCQAKIRYNHQPQPARVIQIGDDELKVEFDQAQAAITPGQAVVLYDGDVILGGGWIEKGE